MIKRIIKWHKRRQRAMRIGMRWIETEENIVAMTASALRGLSSFGRALKLSRMNRKTREPQIVVDSRSWTGRP